MAKDSMTIKDVKEKKIEVEAEILKIIQEFEQESEVRITYISLDRETYEKTAEVPEERRGPIQNVDMNMELDLIY